MTEGTSLRQRLAARIYTTATDPAEYVARKPALLETLTGEVLEIGPGPGTNLPYLRNASRWVGLEPNPILRGHLAERVKDFGRDAEIVAGVAEAIPLPDASVDAVVGTLVLCSVDDQAIALAEIRRVLRPGGRFVFLEHVAAPAGTRTRRWQHRLVPLCRCIQDGCHPDRETLGAISAAGFRTVDHESFAIQTPFGLFSPHIAGTATV